MKHPMLGLGNYGTSDDFSNQDIVDSNDDFGSSKCSGDFGNLGNYQDDGLESFDGHDQGLGFKFKKPKFKVKIKKPSIKSIAKIDSKPIAAIAKPIAKVAPIVSMPMALATQAISNVPVLNQVQSIATNNPLTQKITEMAEKTGLPVSSIMQAVAPQFSSNAFPASAPIYQEQSEALSPIADNTEVVTKTQVINEAAAASIAAKAAPSGYAHPMLYAQKRIKGEPMSGWLDDLKATVSKSATTIYQANKDKAIAAATAQATNLVGKQLTKLSTTSPSASKAITNLVATASTAGTATAMDKVKQVLDENKKYLLIGGAAVVGLIALKMFIPKKA